MMDKRIACFLEPRNFSVVVTSYRRTIGTDDLWDQTPELKSENCIPTLDEEWQREVQRCKRYVIHCKLPFIY